MKLKCLLIVSVLCLAGAQRYESHLIAFHRKAHPIIRLKFNAFVQDMAYYFLMDTGHDSGHERLLRASRELEWAIENNSHPRTIQDLSVQLSTAAFIASLKYEHVYKTSQAR